MRLRTVFDKANESQAVVDALRVVFHLTEGIATDTIQPYESDHSQEQGQERNTSQMNQGQGSCGTDATAGDGNNDDMGQIKVGEDAGDNATDLENEDEERERALKVTLGMKVTEINASKFLEYGQLLHFWVLRSAHNSLSQR